MQTKDYQKEQRILEAATQVFASDGYHKAKISKIAEIAELSIGTVYVYFKNKEAIIVHLLSEVWDLLILSAQKIEKKDLTPSNKVLGIIDEVFNLLLENPGLASIFVNEQHHLILKGYTDLYEKHELFMDYGESFAKEGMADGSIDPHLDTKVFRAFIYGAIRQLLHHSVGDPETYSLVNINESMHRMINKVLNH